MGYPTPAAADSVAQPRSDTQGGTGSCRAQILLIHSDNALRRTWKQALANLYQVEDVSEATDANQAIRTLATMTPDVAVVELSLPGISGLELTRDMIRRQPTIATIICGRSLEPSLITQSFRAGARCYLEVDSVDVVIKAVTSICRGGGYFSEDVRGVLIDTFLDEYVFRLRQRELSSHYSELTSREGEVLQRLITGRTSKAIADELNISVSTVDTHRARIMQKLGVHNLTELIRYALLALEK